MKTKRTLTLTLSLARQGRGETTRQSPLPACGGAGPRDAAVVCGKGSSSIPEFGQHPALETAQHGGLRLARGKPGKRCAVGVEQGLVRIVARQQAQQKFVDIETAHQRRRRPALVARLAHSAEIRVPSSADAVQVSRSGWNASNTPRSIEPRAPRAARQQPHAAEPARERLDDEAGLLVRIGVQHESRLVLGAALHRAPHYR